MENRFGLKDFCVIVLLLGIIVMIGIKMVQDDRQWEQFLEIKQEINAQAKDLAGVRRTLSEGIVTVPGGQSANGGGAKRDNIFRRVNEVHRREDFAEGDWFVESFSAIPPKLNYFTANDIYSRIVYNRVLEPLADTDIETLEMVPYLARDWVVAEDGMTLDVQLREDVRFSDGEPMTSEDVVYSWMSLLLNPEITEGNTRAYYRKISNVEATGEFSVRFTFRQVHYDNVDRALGVPVFPKHFYVQFEDRQIREDPALLMGTGPYRRPDPKKYEPGQPIVLLRNPRYWGTPAPFDRITYRIIEDEPTELIAFRNGEIDIMGPVPDQHLKMLEEEDLVERTRHWVYEHIMSGYSYIAWNQQRDGEKTVFADKRVRQAMTMLIDRDRISKDLYRGFADKTTGPFSHLSKQYNPEVEAWPYDPQRAIDLLLEAGFTKGPDGAMLEPSGEPFEIELIYPAGSESIQKISLSLKDNFARANIALKLVPQKWVLLSKSLQERDFEAITLGWGAGGLESDIEQMFHTRTIEDNGDNRQHYSNPELDALIDKAHVTLDKDERYEIWRKCHKILHEDQPYTFMHRQRSRVWVDGRVANVKRQPPLGLNRVSTWFTPIEWYVPKEKQKRGQD